MLRVFRRLAAFCAALALVAIACRDRGITGPGLPRAVSIALSPRFQLGTESAQPISRIRAAVRRVDAEGDVLDEEPLVVFDETVDPEDESWPVTLDFATSTAVRVIVELELLYVGVDRPTTVEWAARVGPLTVTPGSSRTVEDVPLGRGPLPNLDVTSVSIGEHSTLLFIGDQSTLGASLAPELAGTEVFWGTLDPGVASMDYYGNLVALAAGTARITATAGFESDTINITVVNPVTVLDFLSVDGQGQTAPVGTVVPGPIRVGAYDAGERLLRGVPITFRVSSGGGSLVGANPQTGLLTLVTGADGHVTLPAWTLGNTAGGNAITVTVNGSSVTHCIRATGIAGGAASIVVVSGSAQSGVAGQALAQPLVARVLDQFGNGVMGTSVTFASPQGGSFAPATGASDASGLVQATWTPGATAGTQTATATAAGIATPATFTATVTVPQVGFLVQGSGDRQTAVAGTVLPNPLEVRAFTNGESPIAGAPITFTITGGGGSLAGSTSGSVTILTDANGYARLTGWTLGTTAGRNTISASSGSTTPSLFTATGIAGPAFDIVVVSGSGQSGSTGQALPQPLVARVRDQFGNSVGGVVVTFATTGGGTLAPTQATTDTSGRAQTTWTPGASSTSQTVTATAAGITAPATFTASVTLPPPAVQLALANADKVSLGATQLLNVTLPTPAPAGGTRVQINTSTADFEVLAFPTGGQNISSGNAITIAEGQTQGSVAVLGRTEGNATLTATAPGYDVGTLVVAVELRVIGIPTSINVPYGQTASLPINIARPAPAGGISIQVTSSDPSRVGLTSGTAFIPAGSTTSFVTLNGVLPGPSTIVASHPLYTPDTSAATTTAALDILNTTYQINTSFGATTTVRFLSNGVPVPAPSPGVTVDVVSRNPNCVSVPGTLTILTGLTETSLAMSYNAQGGTTGFPCTSRVVVSSSTGIALDSATVTVAAQPGISVTTASVGRGLQRQWSASLGASNHGGTTVRITSTSPQQVLIAPDASTAGSAFLDVPLVNGGTQVNFVVQALDTASNGAYTITASAPGFVTGTGTATVVTPGLDVVGVNVNPTSLSGNDDFYVRVGVPNGQNTGLNELQDRRAGGAPLVVTATISNQQVIELLSSAGAGTTGTSQIVGNSSNTPTSLGSGGFALRPIGNGTATVTASIPGFITTSSNGTVSVTVTTPLITAGGGIVAGGLQKQVSAFLGAPAPTGGVTVRLTSTDPTLLRVAPNATTAGTDFIDVFVAAGNSSFSYYVQGMEGVTGAPAVTVAAPGYTGARPTFTVVTAALDVVGLNTATTTLTGDDAFYARVGIANGQNTGLNELQDIRAGGTPIVVTFTSGTPAVGTLVNTAGVQGATATATIAVGQSNTPTSVASGGLSLRPLTAGTTRVTGTAPGVITTSSNGVVDVTVSQPAQSVQGATVGEGLQRAMGGFLNASAHGGVTVRLTSNDPSRLLLAPNATTAGTPTLDVTVANNNSSYSFYVQGVEGQAGPVTVTATTPGFASATGTYTIAPAYLDLVGLNTSTTTLTANDEFYARVGVANAAGQFLNELQDIRFGGVPIVVSLATSAPGVAQLVPSATNGTTATVTIPVGQSNSPTSVAQGGVSLDPLTAGTTTVTMTSNQAATTTTNGTVTVTVSAPALTMSTGAVGSGLMRSAFISLGAPAPTGGLTLRLTSSQPSVLLLGPNTTTAGTAFIDVPIAAGASSATFYVHGVDGQTGTPTISATAPGYADGTIAQPVVTPALDVVGVNTSVLASATDDPFNVRIGIPGTNNQSLNQLQDRRAGQPALVVTVTNSNASVGQLVTTAGRSQSVTVSIAPDQSATPSSVATGGVAFDALAPGSTVVSATIPGFITTTSNGFVTVNVQAGEVQAAAVRAAAGR